MLDAVAEPGGRAGPCWSASRSARRPRCGPRWTGQTGAAGVVLAHSLGGLKHQELAELVKADRAAAVQLPVLDRLLTPAFRAEHPDRAFLFQQMGTFNTAKMADLRNLEQATDRAWTS